MRFPNGRSLGYGEIGPEDGTPVLHFPGNPGARQSSLDEASVALAGVRLLTVERPGIGLSTRSPGRRLLDWPADVSALLDVIGVGSCAVVATSAGGPYGLACGARIPDRISRIALRSTVGQVFDRPEFDPLAPGHTALLLARIRAGTTAEELRGDLRGLADVWNSDPDGGWEFFPAMIPTAVRKDFEADGDSARSAMAATFADPEGYADDRVVALSPWGFDPRDVAVPVRAWHGTEDATAALDSVRPVIAQAGGELIVIPNGSHFLPPTVDRDVLDWLTDGPTTST